MDILLLVITLLCFIAPFLRGLFFEAYILPFQIVVFVILAIWCLIKWKKKDSHILKTKVEYIVLGFVIAYTLSIFSSVSVRSAILESLKYAMFFAVFLLLSDFVSNKKYRYFVLRIFILSYFVVCILGLDGFLGGKIVSPINNFFRMLNIDFVFNGLVVENRIGSVIQYPNALAACLSAMLFIVISLYLKTHKIFEKCIYISVSYVFLLTLFLTVSRGIFVIIPIAIVLYILLLPKTIRLESFLLIFFVTSVTIPVFFKVYEHDQLSWMYILWGVFGVCISTLLINYLVRVLSAVKPKVYLFTLTGLSVIAIALTIVVFTVSVPLTVNTNNSGTIEDIRKRVVLTPGNSYRLEVKVEANESDKSNPAYYIKIANKNEGQVVQSKETVINEFNGYSTNGIINKSLTFTVPQDSKMLNLHFGSKAINSTVTFYSAKIYDSNTNKFVDNIILRYKYLPQSIATRFEAFTAADTGIERLIYYKDAQRIIKNYGVIGAGGGAWSVLYPAYQSMYYLANDPHSYLVKLGIETGTVGVAIFLLLIATTAFYIVKRRRNHLYETQDEIVVETGIIAAMSALVLHSCIDLDFSIPSVYLIFWMLMSMLNSFNRNFKSQNKLDTEHKQWGRIYYLQPLLIIAICLVGISFSSMFLVSQHQIAKFNSADKNAVNDKLMYLKKAIDADPFSPLTRIEYANTLVRSQGVSRDILYEAISQISKAEELSYYNTKDMARVAAFYLALGDAGRGLTAVDRSTALSPLCVDSWYQKADAYKNVTMALFQKGKLEDAMKMVDKTLNIINEVKMANLRAMAPVTLYRDTRLVLERMKYIKDYINVQKSINVDSIVFYSINSMDVDSNGIPDQWEKADDFNLSYISADDTISIKKKTEKAILASAKPITLIAGKQYNVKLELAGGDNVNSITMKIKGMYSDNEINMTKEGKYYYLNLEVPQNIKSQNYYFEISIDGDCKIKNLLITKL